MFSSLHLFLTHIQLPTSFFPFQLPPLFSHTSSVPSSFFSSMFSCLHFFLKTLSVLSLFLTHLQFSVISNCFSHFQFSPFFLTHSIASSFFSNTFGCLRHSKKYSSPFFSHTFSSLPFFLSPRVAFGIQKKYI